MLRGKGDYQSTNSILNLIIVYGVATGAISSAIALAIFFSNELHLIGLGIFTGMGTPAIMISAVLANLQLRHALRVIVEPPYKEAPPTSSVSLDVIDIRHPTPNARATVAPPHTTPLYSPSVPLKSSKIEVPRTYGHRRADSDGTTNTDNPMRRLLGDHESNSSISSLGWI
ncbi:hypothetical protein DL93DRAFT_1152827 [Clavulina sp. PMI_390]|nr:hypothetical protein DL93DRAFT_1152827 [Clavulina sp. PMI_390]